MPRFSTPEALSAHMRLIKKADTKPEMSVRRLVHGMGYRYRLHRRDLPGTPDLVFPRLRKVIFVHGCFWHQHIGCRLARQPKSRQEYWLPKLARNIERDRFAQDQLQAFGWRVLTVWECETKDEDSLRQKLVGFLAN